MKDGKKIAPCSNLASDNLSSTTFYLNCHKTLKIRIKIKIPGDFFYYLHGEKSISIIESHVQLKQAEQRNSLNLRNILDGELCKTVEVLATPLQKFDIWNSTSPRCLKLV